MGADIEKLHAAIDEDPELAADYLVLADHLLELGDPRGELISLSHKTDKSARLRRAILERMLGPDLSVEVRQEPPDQQGRRLRQEWPARVDQRQRDLIYGLTDGSFERSTTLIASWCGHTTRLSSMNLQ